MTDFRNHKNRTNMIAASLACVLFLAGCRSSGKDNSAAPSVDSLTRYVTTEGSEFNLLNEVTVTTQSGTNVHTTLSDYSVEKTGTYDVMLTAYDDYGNITIRNMKILVTDRPKEPAPDISERDQKTEQEKIVDAAPTEEPSTEPTPEPTPKMTATPTPTPAATPTPVTDPYAQAKAECAASWGTWTGTSCVWPTPEPTLVPSTPQTSGNSNPYGYEGGTTTCWQEGNQTVCEWVGEWEEYEE